MAMKHKSKQQMAKKRYEQQQKDSPLEVHSKPTKNIGYSRTLYLIAIILVLLLVAIYVQQYFRQTGKAFTSPDHAQCISEWSDFCYSNECTDIHSAQCQAYCAERTKNRCDNPDMPLPRP